MEGEPKMVPCPDCGGTGKIAPALDNLPGEATADHKPMTLMQPRGTRQDLGIARMAR
jgi:hypothetical protein